MLNQLQWPTLRLHRYVSRLSQIHKIVHHHNTAINMPSYYMPIHHIQQDNTYQYIIYFHHQLATSKASFLNQSNSETAYKPK